MHSHGISARRQRRKPRAKRGDSQGHAGDRSSFLEPPARSFFRTRDHKSAKGPWKLPEPWTPRTRPPLLGKPEDRFPTATTGSFFFLS
jgi:hypothetical protein